MSESNHRLKLPRRRRLMALAVIICAVAAMLPRPASSGSKDDTTGTVSKAEPALKQDGTPAYPFADASQCPTGTDLVIWPSGRLVPNLPADISVCVVGDQSFNEGGSDVQVRGR